MRNCVVLGCGRSGTSLVAGLIEGAGYDVGADLLAPNEGNPKGHFEDIEINEINEALLAPHVRDDGPASRPLRHGERWLAALPVEVEVGGSPALADRMAAAVADSPFCRKDPRFSYTLPAWEPFVDGALRICVFREPARTAHSLCSYAAAEYEDLSLDYEAGLRIWTSVYRHVLERHAKTGDWHFLHYDSVLDGSAIDGLEKALGVEIDHGFADPSLRRSPAHGDLPAEVAETYEALQAAAAQT